MQRIFILLLAASAMIAISGCGNKGPLYLPPEPVEQAESSETSDSES